MKYIQRLLWLGLFILPVCGVNSHSIHFIGTIVQEGCAVYLNQQKIDSDCQRQGERSYYQQQAYPFNSMMLQQRQPYFIRQSQMQWLDKSNKVGQLEIEYR